MDGNREDEIKEIAKLGKRISESGSKAPQKAGKNEFRDKGEDFSEFLDKIPDSIIIVDRKGTLLEASDMAVGIGGYRKGDVIGKNIVTGMGILDANTKALIIKRMAAHFSGKEVPPCDIEIRTKGGRVVPIEMKSSIIDYKGKKAELVIFRDLTERRKAQQALRESEERYRVQFEQALDAIFIADAKTGILLDCNQVATELVERSKNEIVGKHQRILHPTEKIKGEFSETFRKHLKEAQGKTLETKVITKSGKLKDVAIKANLIDIGGKKLLQGIFRDITEHKKAQEAISESESRLKDIIQGSPIPQFIIDRDHKVIAWNTAMEEYSGIKAEKVLNTDNQWKAFYASKRPCMVDLLMDNSIKDLSKWYGENFTKSRYVKGAYEVTAFFPKVKGTGSWLHFTATTINDKQGNPICAMETLDDVTERKKAEEDLKKLNEELKSKLEELEKINRLAIGRELRMVELKKRIEELEGKAKG